MFDLNSDDSGESEPDLEPLVVQPLLNPSAEDEAAAETTGAGGAAGAVVSAAPSNYTIGEVEHEQHHDAIVAAGELAANAEEDAAGISLIRSSKAYTVDLRACMRRRESFAPSLSNGAQTSV